MRLKTAELAAHVAGALAREPGGVKQVCLAIGMDGQHTVHIRRYVEAFRAVGLCHIVGWTNQRFPVYAWQPSPFYYPDAVRPQRKNKPRQSQIGTRSAPIRLGANSVFALGAT